MNLTIGVYQPTKGLFRGSNAQKVLFYTVPLDQTVNQSNGLPLYLGGSYGADPTLNTQSDYKGLELNQGDVLVWEGRTILRSIGAGGAAFMVFKWECK